MTSLGWCCALLIVALANASRIAQARSFGEGAQTIGAQQMTRPLRVHGGLLYGPSVGLYMESTGLMVVSPVTATIEEFADKWAALHELLGEDHADAAAQAAAKLISSAQPMHARSHSLRRLTRAPPLLTDRIRVLHDVTNPVPKTQPGLTRAAMNDAHHVDQALREISRRLLGNRAGAAALEERLDSSVPGQAKAWALTCQYLAKRLQASANDCPGREPDMSLEASSALRAVLSEMGTAALQVWAEAEGAPAEGVPAADAAATATA